jgi:hypothetical protein
MHLPKLSPRPSLRRHAFFTFGVGQDAAPWKVAWRELAGFTKISKHQNMHHLVSFLPQTKKPTENFRGLCKD